MELIRNIGIWAALEPLDRLISSLLEGSELNSLSDRTGRYLLSFRDWFFNLCYSGSKQEIEDALNYSEYAWPSMAMSERQQKARKNASDDSFYKQSLIRNEGKL